MTKFIVIVRILDMNRQDTGKRATIDSEGIDTNDALNTAKNRLFKFIEHHAEQWETIEIADVVEEGAE